MGGRGRRDRFPGLTVEGQSSQLMTGTAGYITSGAGYILANPARADTAFVAGAHIARRQARPVHQSPASARLAIHGSPARPRASAYGERVSNKVSHLPDED